eukprot:scaffold12427_cov51-Cyclotella_meneghiniana.AAC.3
MSAQPCFNHPSVLPLYPTRLLSAAPDATKPAWLESTKRIPQPKLQQVFNWGCLNADDALPSPVP